MPTAVKKTERGETLWAVLAVGVITATVAVTASAVSTHPANVVPADETVIEPTPTRGWSCPQSSTFVKHDPDLDPASPGAGAVRFGGFLVTSDGAGGSCVYNDRRG
jgi:hypothetical protein